MLSPSDRAPSVPHPGEFGINEWFVDEFRERYLRDPDSVDPVWREYFRASAATSEVTKGGVPLEHAAATAGGADAELVVKAVRVAALIHSYRVRGHLVAATNPLAAEPSSGHPDLEPSGHGLVAADAAREFPVNGFAGCGSMTLAELQGALRDAYCGTTGIEYMHIQSPQERLWIQQHVEGPQPRHGRAEQLRILHRLGAAEAFETFLHTKYVGQKRYSLEGGESAIVLLDALLACAARLGTREVVIGMAHRGRLNVLANIVGKPYAQIFDEFEDAVDIRSAQGSGDVKYHLGAAGTFHTADGRAVAVSVMANPSHLEIVGPVAQGVVRGRQDAADDSHGPLSVLPVVVHGDAAFAGQGVVAETLNMSQLPGYRTGGTVHVIINNQLGFTTAAAGGRSSTYATDVARTVEAPILHVNGDDPEAVDRVAQLAFRYRGAFGKDVVIDLVCYRRHGHSEVDDPSITQPAMYDRIAARSSVRQLYAQSLLGAGVIGEQEVERARQDYRDRLDQAFAETAGASSPDGAPEPVRVAGDRAASPGATAVGEATLQRVVATQITVPAGFTTHPRVLPQLQRRIAMLDGGQVDWATAEALAIGSLILDGVPVRLAGQDSRRGTFGQRHAVLTDRRTGQEHTPLNTLGPGAARFTPYDSQLSELAVLAFEYGYSLARPEGLVLWEAQFGDFANGAQMVVDEYVSSSEQKWGQRSGVTLLLPHGLEGQGPDHSSGRLERFLQLCADDNMTVANPSLPGNYFHLLRGQGLADRPRPLVVFTPKSMLRLKTAVSGLAEFTGGSFRPVLPDSTQDPRRTERVLLCSGKVFYDLDAHRRASGQPGTAIVTLERLYPFPSDELAAELSRYPSGVEVRWIQEEPANQGAWTFVDPRIADLLPTPVECVSRPAASAPAVGSARRHTAEQQDLVRRAFA
ncbi:multifunctional oxoglutarate decarboxylase/oxoglutarate dehydrogenase thiamine pyrophosphate-binding subunit/dihydrolipoyllysine-residue succinyltransferase subunit [Streptomyces sp. NBC_01198]|uniref:multifunctional oxoglutarate decarboxylase/oxoglutarate dehydrogenase thiamine pyrophosphate-binding subunit/dihydrolipoyllysine-residue succinyltransferase subunit n=1 Tax=Streptomyces sp. NBC_01198 TaxID=2903769 RepID=UPI002E15A819|nr:multifunctional oxoglutarate decarboxylase/oxoglutarate dehydrogenase thiamine pyrophosphate-binding subunit/dihydrolipoyllysine-residue succinyltransferase subunit [Streptomyces sp. NBC_01198]